MKGRESDRKYMFRRVTDRTSPRSWIFEERPEESEGGSDENS